MSHDVKHELYTAEIRYRGLAVVLGEALADLESVTVEARQAITDKRYQRPTMEEKIVRAQVAVERLSAAFFCSPGRVERGRRDLVSSINEGLLMIVAGQVDGSAPLARNRAEG